MFKITKNVDFHIGAMENTMMEDIKTFWGDIPDSYLLIDTSWDDDASPMMMENMSRHRLGWARNIDVTKMHGNHRKGYEEMTIHCARRNFKLGVMESTMRRMWFENLNPLVYLHNIRRESHGHCLGVVTFLRRTRLAEKLRISSV